MITQEVLERVFKMMCRQNFADWYNSGRFDAFISGVTEGEAPTKEQVLSDLGRMLGA